LAAEEFKGRVMSLYWSLFRGGPSLSALVIGLGAGWLGLRELVACAGGLALILIARLARAGTRALEERLRA
jgi:hypothetical protein